MSRFPWAPSFWQSLHPHSCLSSFLPVPYLVRVGGVEVVLHVGDQDTLDGEQASRHLGHADAEKQGEKCTTPGARQEACTHEHAYVHQGSETTGSQSTPCEQSGLKPKLQKIQKPIYPESAVRHTTPS